MAANIGFAYMSVVPSFQGVTGKLEKGIAGPAEKVGKTAGGKVRSGMLGSLKNLAGPMVALMGVATLKKAFSGAIAEATEARKISALTDAALKSTGGAANITAKEVGALAGALSMKAGVDDELIQSSANVLLTFTKVRNEAGKGNDIFNQGTAAALDMSVALGTDLKGATLQIGKALNDPIKGVSALSRAGVSFTAQQKEQIKTLVASGDTLNAQKLILSEMQTQFGGAAKAAADPMDKLRVASGNLSELVGTALLPIVDTFATVMANNVIPAIVALPGFLQRNKAPILVVATAITAFLLPAFIQSRITATRAAVVQVRAWLTTQVAAAKSLAAHVAAAAGVVAGWVRMGARAVAHAARVVAGWVLMGAQSLLQAGRMALAWVIAMGPIGWVIAAVVGLVALVIANWDKIVRFTKSAWTTVSSWMREKAQQAKDWVVGKFTAMVDWFKSLPSRIVKALGNMGSLLVQAGKDLISGLIRGATEFIKEIPGKIADAAKGIGSSLINGLSKLNPFGDGPGRGAGGSVLARIQSVLPRGAYVTNSYRSPAQNAAVGGSPTSYHMDRNNPAVDIGGSTSVLDALYQRLKAMGGWRELLWRVKGHFDHIHAADQGGVFQGPGFVWMGAGRETFASGLGAQKVGDLPKGGPHVVDFTITDWQRGIGQMRIEWNSDIERRDAVISDALTYGRN